MALLLAALSQIGMGASALRLCKKIDKRQEEHEKVDNQFQVDVKAHLGMPMVS